MCWLVWRDRHDRDQGRIQDFKLGGGAHLKKLRRAENFWVFRVKNHNFTPKKSYFSNFRGGGARKFWGISCEKSRFYAKKIIFFPILGGARAGCAPPRIRPWWSYGSWIYNFLCNQCLHHWCCGRGAQRYVVKFVSDLRQVGGFLRVLWFPPSIKLTATI